MKGNDGTRSAPAAPMGLTGGKGSRLLAPRRARVRDATEAALADSVVLSSEGRGWRGVDAALLHTAFDGVSVPPPDTHLVALHLNRADRAVESEGLSVRQSLGRGIVGVMPAGLPFEARWEGCERLEVFHAHPEPSFVSEVASEAGVNGAEILPCPAVRDERLERTMLSLLDELKSWGLGGELYAEGLAQALAVHLLREHSSLGEKAKRKLAREPAKGGGLSARALQATTDYIGDNLSGELSLSELAAVANLSAYHFSRLFKRSTGISPHQYVVRERVARAKGLLLRGDLPVAAVAREVGFSDQGHLSRHTKRLLGATPGEILREAKAKESKILRA